MKDTIRVRRKGETPKFVVRFWDVSKAKLIARGHDVSSKGLSKRWAKHYYEGQIEHVQSGKSIIFHSVGELLTFFEKYRM